MNYIYKNLKFRKHVQFSIFNINLYYIMFAYITRKLKLMQCIILGGFFLLKIWTIAFFFENWCWNVSRLTSTIISISIESVRARGETDEQKREKLLSVCVALRTRFRRRRAITVTIAGSILLSLELVLGRFSGDVNNP